MTGRTDEGNPHKVIVLRNAFKNIIAQKVFKVYNADFQLFGHFKERHILSVQLGNGGDVLVFYFTTEKNFTPFTKIERLDF